MDIASFILFTLLAQQVFTLSSQKLIYVSQTGIDDSSCWKGGYSTPCLSLNLAFKGAQHYNHFITILLQPGQHQLHNGSETQLRNVSQLAIVGNGSEGEVVITCQPLAGLAFFECSEIRMKNIKLVGCGALHNSTSQYIRGYSSTILKIQVAVLFRSCEIVQLTEVHVIKSNGTGVILYNPIDMVCIDKCQFMHNGLSDKQPQAALHAGGGGLVIEANDATSQSFCTIANSIFTGNTASSGQFSFLSPIVNPSGYFGLGRGGGISVVFRGGAANNTMIIESVQLENNTAQFGGGIFLVFHNATKGNNVSIANTRVARNKAMTMTDAFTSGGGVFITYVAIKANYPFNNTVTISSAQFTLNKAKKGGGVTVYTQRDTDHYRSPTGNKLLITNCAFDKNAASAGSSVIISQSEKDSWPLLVTTVCDSNFTNAQCGDFCTSSVLIDSLPLIFKGALIFSGNHLSALGLHSSSIELLPSTQLQFINNNARNGAALYIADCGLVVVNNCTSLSFKNNTAGNNGGAIYVETCEFDKAENCFIRHSNPALHPDDWNTSFTFLGNQDQANLENSIYIDSIQSCVWSDSSKQQTAFCWNGWSYRDTSGVKDYCLNQLKSGPSYIKKSGLTRYTVYPGECINLFRVITVFDVWDHDITNRTYLQTDVLSDATDIFIMKSFYEDCYCSYFPLPNCLLPHQLTKRPCRTHDVVLLTNCSNEYYNYTSQILIHPPRLPDGIVLDIAFKLCDNKTTCDYGECCPNYDDQYVCYNTVGEKYNYSSYDYDCESNYKSRCIFSYNTICGSCTDPDYGIAVNFPHFTCAKCEPFNAAIYICLGILPVLILMTILTVFNINIVNGNLNAFILYSQMVTLQFPGLGYTGWVPNTELVYFNYYFLGIPLTVYSIWNLNFLTLYRDPFCIPGIRTATGVILLQYVTAACPLLFIIVSYTWIQCYNNGYRLVVYTTRPVHRLLAHLWRKLKIQPSLIDTYAGLLLLAYMRFLAVSAKLLQFIAIDAQSSSPLETMPVHATLGAIAVLCLLVFNLLPMTVVSLYHLKIYQQFLTWCRLNRPGLHALVDAYQGCFKNSATDGKERRYFAGIYLLFRFCYVAFFVTFLSPVIYFYVQNVALNPLGTAEASLSVAMIGIILLLQPYKQKVHNIIDFLIIFYMGAIGGLSSSNFSLYVTIGPLFLPFLVLFAYNIYRLLKCCWCACVAWTGRRNESENDERDYSQLENQPAIAPLTTTTEVSLDNYVHDELYADRILHPSEYKLFD